jgi:hypothetical protein
LPTFPSRNTTVVAKWIQRASQLNVSIARPIAGCVSASGERESPCFGLLIRCQAGDQLAFTNVQVDEDADQPHIKEIKKYSAF